VVYSHLLIVDLDVFLSIVTGELLTVANFAIIVKLAMEKHIKLKKVKRARKHGFLHRMATHDGQKVLKRRRAKSRQSLSV